VAVSTDEQTTVTIEGEGFSTGPIPMDEFNEAADRARDRLRVEQLSFDLGVSRTNRPDFATVKISGSMLIGRDLRYREPVTVKMVDQYGEVVCEAPATIGYPAFRDHLDKDGGKQVERIHTAKIDGPDD
jgi:hypothetical protein